jgi:hypothetical protein
MNPSCRAAAPLAACLLAAMLAGSAHAQPGITPLRVGQSLTGQLVASDEPVNGRGRFHAYRVEAAEGQRLLMTAESPEFDTYLVVGRQVGPVLNELKSDDDGGEGTHSRLRFTAPRAGSYIVLVQSFAEEGMGPYTVALAEAPAPTTGGNRPISFGGTEEGTLADTDNEDEETGKFYDEYTFRGRAGQRVEIEMRSEDFDSYLRLGRLDGCDWQELATDDDGGEDTHARLRYTLPGDGEYVVRATSFGENTGAYTLALRERAASAQGPVQRRPITAGQTVTSALDESDPVLEADNSFYELWTYQGRAGEQLRISMTAEAFDTYLAIGQMRGGEFEEIATMDDGGEGTNSLMEVTLPTAGEYVIRANSFGADETGEYTLRVESTRTP